jgi:hypothetical protein
MLGVVILFSGIAATAAYLSQAYREPNPRGLVTLTLVALATTIFGLCVRQRLQDDR